MQMLRQVRSETEGALFTNPAGEFVERFYNEGRGDVILESHRCPLPILESGRGIDAQSRGQDVGSLPLSEHPGKKGRVLCRESTENFCSRC